MLEEQTTMALSAELDSPLMLDRKVSMWMSNIRTTSIWTHLTHAVLWYTVGWAAAFSLTFPKHENQCFSDFSITFSSQSRLLQLPSSLLHQKIKHKALVWRGSVRWARTTSSSIYTGVQLTNTRTSASKITALYLNRIKSRINTCKPTICVYKTVISLISQNQHGYW